MRVAPFLEIVIVDVHSAGVAYPPIDDHYLAVIPEVKPRGHIERMLPWIREFDYFHPRLTHILIVFRADWQVSYILMDESHLHPLPCLGHEQLLYAFAAVVVPEMEIFHVD